MMKKAIRLFLNSKLLIEFAEDTGHSGESLATLEGATLYRQRQCASGQVRYQTPLCSVNSIHRIRWFYCFIRLFQFEGSSLFTL